MFKPIIRSQNSGVSAHPAGSDIFPSIATDKLPERNRARGKSPRDLVLEQAEELREEARQRGFAQGLAEGLEQGKAQGFEAGRAEGMELARQELEAGILAEIEAFRAGLESAGHQLSEATETWFLQAEARLAELATTMVQRILHSELKSHPDAILALVQRAIDESGEPRKLKVRINPMDHATVANFQSELLQRTRSIESIEVVDDPSILGGCIVEADSDQIDLSLESFDDLLHGEAA